MLNSIITKLVISSNKGVYVYAECPYCLKSHHYGIGGLTIDPFLKLGVRFPTFCNQPFGSPNLRLLLDDNTIYEGQKNHLQTLFENYEVEDKGEYGVYLTYVNPANGK
jgi:hypothetical protein